ncbi:MAG: hypothetical protein RLZ35_1047 [Pseudomonadota bacterium]|jgi:prevent-host-death family protein
MQYYSASELKNQLATIIDVVQREPVIVQKKGRDVAIILSPTEYQDYQRYKKHAFVEFCQNVSEKAIARGLTPEKLAEILAETENDPEIKNQNINHSSHD